MEVATTEEKFHAAVELIKNLPKSGNIQPSNDVKLKFYSYYKQATEGPCELPRPGFWDVVNRAKWDAWNKLGNMSKEEAMTNYVQEFVGILETTPFDDTDTINEYIHLMGPYIDYAPKEIKEKHFMNGKVNKIRKNSEENLQKYNKQNSGKPLKGYDNISDKLSEGHNSLSNINGHNINCNNESDSDEFSDTLDRVNESEPGEILPASDNGLDNNPAVNTKGPNIVNVRGGGDQRMGNREGNSPAAGASGNRGNRSSRQPRNSDNLLPYVSNNNNIGGAGGSRRNGGNNNLEQSGDVNEQLAMAVIRLQHIMEQIVVRLDSLEALLIQNKTNNSSLQVASKKRFPMSFFGLSPKAAIVILAWPFIVHWLMYLIKKRNRRL